MGEIIFEILNPNEIDEVNELYRDAYSKMRTKEQFAWEFINGPCGKAIYIVAKDTANGRIIGTQCAIPLYVNSKGEKILTAKSEDTLVHSSYRGKNIFERMYAVLFDECKKAGINFIWGFTYVVKPFAKIGFEVPFRASMGILAYDMIKSCKYLGMLNPKNSLADLIKIFFLVLISRFQSFKTVFISKNIEKYEIHEGHTSDLNILLRKNMERNKNYFSLHQDEKFLNWRVCQNPYPGMYRQYSLLESSNNVVGNIIYYEKNGIVHIIQLLFNPDISAKIKSAFLKTVILKMRDNKNFLIRYWGFNHNEYMKDEMKFLKSTGFLFINRGITFVWKSLTDRHFITPSQIIISRMASQGVN